jgi:geranylgeranyl diphosphate synthase, type I
VTRALPAAVSLSRERVAAELRAAADLLAPDIRTVIAYHLGWIEADGRASGGRGGKALRPALALLSARAAGAGEEVALPGAVGVELVHNFSLLHDDIMDRDERRHHRPSAWTVFGESRAILAGDALLTLAARVLLDDPAPERVRAAGALLDATARLIDGQSQDLALEGRLDVSLDEYVSMISAKTAALLSCASAIGAMLAGASEPLVGALERFGTHVGLAFQIVDDALGIWGEPEVTGKPAGSDLRRRKSSFPIVAALGGGGAEARELAAILSGPEIGDEAVARGQALLESCGARELAAAETDRHLDLALRALRSRPLEPEGALALEEIARFVTDREL